MKETLITAINEKNVEAIRKKVRALPLSDVVKQLETMNTQQQLIFFRLLQTQIAAKIFTSLQSTYQKKLITAFSNKENLQLFENLYLDEAADLIEDIPANIAKMILDNTTKEKRLLINKLLSYQDDEVGSIMNSDITVLKKSWTVRRALFEIKKWRNRREISSFYFVKTTKNTFAGMIGVEDLMFSAASTPIQKLLFQVEPIHTKDNLEEATFVFKKQDLAVLPVINHENILVGMITSDDVIDVIESEASEDIQKMAGIDPLENSYFSTSIFKIVRSRIFWLLFLMISATISQIVLDVFIKITDSTFAESNSNKVITTTVTTLLVTIIPVISGSAGNAGSQASTTITRGIALKEITPKDYGKIIWREFQIGLAVGLIMGIVNFLRLIIYYFVKEKGSSLPSVDVWIAFGSSLSLLVVITISKLVGGLLPILAKLCRQDPAVMAAPLISTLTDALSSVLFFSINIAVLLVAL